MRRSVMRRFVLVAAGTLVGLCAACSDNPRAELPPTARVQTSLQPDAPSEVSLTATIYKQAMDKARKTLTIDNAKQRLEDMDAQIEQEKEMLR